MSDERRSIRVGADAPSAGVLGDVRPLWTVEDLCQFLNVSKRWVHERTRRGEIPCYRLGTVLRFDSQEIRQWVAQYRSTPDSVGGKNR